jgi:hypothetical protein
MRLTAVSKKNEPMIIPKQFPVSFDDPTEQKIEPNSPDVSQWEPYDEWRMVPDSGDGASRYWNSRYSVTVVRDHRQSLMKARCWRALVIRADQSAHRDYRDFMRIKDDLFGPSYEAIELLPSRSREIGPSNAFYMFVFDAMLPIGEPSRNVLHPSESKAPQRKFERTKTTSRTVSQ